MSTIRLLRAALCATLLLAGCATPQYQPGADAAIQVIAHRGASAYAPENTLPAFAKAAEQGADWFELDCRFARDQRMIVFHDGTLERYTGEKRSLLTIDFDTLRSVDVGSLYSPAFAGTHMPTLRESLALAKEHRIGVYVEIKGVADDGPLHKAMLAQAAAPGADPASLAADWMRLVEEDGTLNLALTRQAIRDIRAERMTKQVVIQSFSPVICLVARREAPEIRTELLVTHDPDHPEYWPSMLTFGYGSDVQGFNVHHEALNAERVAAFQAQGKTVATWTVDNPARMKELVAMGVNGLITNKPDVALEVLGRTAR